MGEDGGPPKGIQTHYITPDTCAAFGIDKPPEDTDPSCSWVDKEPVYKHIQVNGKISDWYEAKAFIDKVEGDRFLVVYDGEEVMGEDGWYMCQPAAANNYLAAFEAAKVVQAAKYKELKSLQKLELGLSDDEEEEEDLTPVVIPDIQPSEAGWEPLGSEDEVKELSVGENRPRVVVTLKRKRMYYGRSLDQSPFFDTDAGDMDPIDIRSVNVRDPNFALERRLGHSGVQAVPVVLEASSQTPWFRKQHASIQYEARTLPAAECEGLLQSEEMTDFLRTTRDIYELSLQQNEVVNNYEDAYKNGDDEGETFGQATDENIAEAFSFIDRDKSVQCIEYHPTLEGLVGMAACERGDFDERVEQAGRIPRSKVFIYDFTESIAMEPVIILDAPDDITVFKFSPTMPHLVAGGTKTGQVVLWDISAAESTLKSKSAAKKANESGGDDSEKAERKPVHWTVLSFIDSSHSAPVADIQWLPTGSRYDPKGKLHESPGDVQFQFVSASADGNMIVWDAKQGIDVSVGTLDPMCYDCTWSPTWRSAQTSSSGGTSMAFENLSFGIGADDGLKWMASTQEGEVAVGEGFAAAGESSGTAFALCFHCLSI
eukprot:SAG22_NODE_1249_length_5012_cov_1.781396_3_plen_599_part_00